MLGFSFCSRDVWRVLFATEIGSHRVEARVDCGGAIWLIICIVCIRRYTYVRNNGNPASTVYGALLLDVVGHTWKPSGNTAEDTASAEHRSHNMLPGQIAIPLPFLTNFARR
ncbi:hypothetical protein BD309DRAFT_411825 [Dichomitus squalens]|nr:hypothetical protein BD309DRAFT_411825 [Dichomitus squalens]